jgi:hypothetical protein
MVMSTCKPNYEAKHRISIFVIKEVPLTLNGRILRKTFFRIPWQHKTEDVGLQQGQNPVLAMVFGIASEASVVLYGSVYHLSPRYKSLIPNPEAS